MAVQKKFALGRGLDALISNEEVKTIFSETVVEWFRDNMRDTNRQPLMAALWEGEEEKASAMLSELLFHTISYHNYKEDFYHHR